MSDAEQGATGRRWRVALPLTGVGVALLIYGVFAESVLAVGAGLALTLAFGYVAAGARKTTVEVSKESVKAEADFTAPPAPSDAARKIYVPRTTKRKP